MNEVEALLNLLSTGCAVRTFGKLEKELSNLRKSFPKSEKKDFRLAVCLAVLLGDEFNASKTQAYESVAILASEADISKDGILSPAGRLAALYLIHHLYRNAVLSQNPFLPFFVEIIDSPSSTTLTLEIEADFLIQLLWKTPDLVNKTPRDIIRTYRSRPEERPDLAPIRKLWEERQPLELTPLSCHGLRRVVREQNRDPTQTKKPQILAPFDLEKEFNLQAFEPEMVRPEPELLPVTEHELRWLDITDQEEFSWDEKDNHSSQRMSELMEAAMRSRLSLQQEDELLKLLSEKSAVQMLADIEFNSQKLTELVRSNPKIATRVLLTLKHTPEITEYYNVLIKMDMTDHNLGLHCIQIVNDITGERETPPVPSDFVHQFITNVLQSCQWIQDACIQTRLVRLVCVLVQTLIRTKVINIKDLSTEMQHFCILFARMKEVTALYRFIRNQIKEPDTTKRR